MALFDRVMQMMALAPWEHPPVQVRTSLEDLVARTGAARDRPYRPATVHDALSVPAIFGAVKLISNLVGSLSMRAFRGGAELADDERPRLVIRPNPFTTPREFYRETAWSMATYGEAWWWVMARDIDNSPISLMPVHPVEVTVEENPRDPRYPVITWRGQARPNADMIQIKMTGETGALRGKGPLQMCGAAVSVSVEAQEWAANFFAEDGGYPSIGIKAAGALGYDEEGNSEAEALRDQWMGKPHNTPRVYDEGIAEIKEFGVNQQGAQMLEARNWQNGEVARMFTIPGPLLEFLTQGSSLTYQNIGQEFAKLLRVCLLPDYLEPMEQAMSDQLTRSTTGRFNTEALERADIKTLYDVAGIGLDKGIFTSQDEARAIVGLAPSVETAAVPFSPPQAVPATIPDPNLRVQTAFAEPVEVRCTNCRKLLGKLTPPYEVVCQRCKTMAAAA